MRKEGNHLSQLTQPQKIIFNQSISLFQSSPTTISLATKLYRQYHQIYQVDGHTLFDNICLSFFLAQTLTEVKDLKGHKVDEIGFHANKIIKNCECLIQCGDIIRNYLQIIKPPSEIEGEIHKIFYKIGLIKERTKQIQNKIEKLQLQEKVSQSFGYKETFKSLICLLYVNSLKQNLIELQSDSQSNCLIASILYLTIRYSFSYIKPKKLIITQQQTMKSIISQILDSLVELFEIQQIEEFKIISQIFDTFFENMIGNSIMKGSKSETDFFSPFIININYKRLDNQYKKSLDSTDIDYRLFWKINLQSLTPPKHDGILKRTNRNIKKIKEEEKKKYLSHRVLKYDQILQENNDIIEEDGDSFKLVVKGINRCKRQDRKNINEELQRYVNRYVQTQFMEVSRMDKSFTLLSWICKNVQEYHQLNTKNNILFMSNIYSAFLIQFCTEFNQSESIQVILAIICIEITNLLFSTTHDFSGSFLQTIQLFYSLNYQVTSHILSLSLSIIQNNPPPILKHHLLVMLGHLIKEECWKSEAFSLNQAQIDKRLQDYILQYCQSFILESSSALNLTQQIENGAICCLKYILEYCDDIVFYRKLDQIIVCSLYVSCRKSKRETKFIDIKNWYERSYGQNSNGSIFFDVQINNKMGDLIGFYNEIFLQSIREYLSKWPQINKQNQIKAEHLDIALIGNKPVNLNIIEEKCPKNNLSEYHKEHNMQIKIQTSDRNETKVRIRPSLLIYERIDLCETEKIKSYL